MEYEVTVTNKVLIKLNEKYYNDDFLEDVKEYWGLNSYEKEEVLEWVAEHIGLSIVQGHNIHEIEGIHNLAVAHSVLQENKEVEVEEIKIR